ncbi:MAG: hypothetical protein FWC93_08415 [Defluviitaleaceae bacterium]|nr:hypothetical protein [Defluviitaleaceae bacterium]
MKKWTVVCILTISIALTGCVGPEEPREATHPSYAGTIDGIEMPIAHFNFFYNQAFEDLLWADAAPPEIIDASEFHWTTVQTLGVERVMAIDDSILLTPFQKFNAVTEFDVELDELGLNLDMMTEAMEIAFNSTVDLHLTINRAEEFGLSTADVYDEHVEMFMMFHNQSLFMSDPNIAALGFTDETYRQFVTLQILQILVHGHIADYLTPPIPEEVLAQAFEQFLDENPEFLTPEVTQIDLEWLEEDFKRTHEGQLREEYSQEMLEMWRAEAEIVNKIP